MIKQRTLLFCLVFALCLGLAPLQAARAEAPDQAYISGLVGHAQIYSLSCESRSAADWAAYWGVPINEVEFLNSLPQSDNPNEGFVGSPHDPWGYIPPYSYGVHADPVARVLRSYGLDAHADTDLSWEDLREEIAAGRPVIVWVIGSIWAGSAKTYTTEDGEDVRVANNEHTMILIGYNQNQVHLVDALTGFTITHSLENFLTSWAVLGNMAVLGNGSGDGSTVEQPQAPVDGESYTVQQGDTLNKVAVRLGLHWVDIAAWNQIGYPYIIYPGQTLIVSADGESAQPTPPVVSSEETYTVQRGDHLMKIARDLEIDWTDLATLNNLAPPFLLYPGTVLTLPATNEEIEEQEQVEVDVPEVYTASSNESLLALAHYYGLDWIKVAGLNNLAYPYILSPGQTITLVKQ
jgi:uncharacterized protein YvpB/LysM repeat protein